MGAVLASFENGEAEAMKRMAHIVFQIWLNSIISGSRNGDVVLHLWLNRGQPFIEELVLVCYRGELHVLFVRSRRNITYVHELYIGGFCRKCRFFQTLYMVLGT